MQDQRPNPQDATNDHKNIYAAIFLDRENRNINELDIVRIIRLINSNWVCFSIRRLLPLWIPPFEMSPGSLHDAHGVLMPLLHHHPADKMPGVTIETGAL